MAIAYRVLGAPGRDNALWVEVDSGQSVDSLLFDCGEDCLRDVPIARVQTMRGLFFSHFHIDHVAGFDGFLRHNFARESDPVLIFGPDGAIETIHHRLRGFTWNLVAGSPGRCEVREISETTVRCAAMKTSEGFALRHTVGEEPFVGPVMKTESLAVDAVILDHGTPSIAYIVREPPRQNIQTARLAELGLRPGPWLGQVKNPTISDEADLEVDGQQRRVGDLRRDLLESHVGESLAYLTDFSLRGDTRERLVAAINGCDTLVCENNFRNRDRELADRSFHLVSDEVAQLAADANVGRLVLFHLSDRYTVDEWREQLAEVRKKFANATFPPQWKLDEPRIGLISAVARTAEFVSGPCDPITCGATTSSRTERTKTANCGCWW